jgi:hypothetical protein
LTEQSTTQTQEKSQIASHQERIGEYPSKVQKVPWLLSNQGSKAEKKIDVANTLLARDYKGFGNQAMNGVIEIERS